MRTLLLGLAYFIIYTTPILVMFLLWVLWEFFSTDHTILSLTGHIFLKENLLFLYDWIYSWFWNDWLDFWYSFPIIILATIKLIINTWLGFWLLHVAKNMYN